MNPKELQEQIEALPRYAFFGGLHKWIDINDVLALPGWQELRDVAGSERDPRPRKAQESAPPPDEPTFHFSKSGIGAEPAAPAPGDGDTARIVKGIRESIGLAEQEKWDDITLSLEDILEAADRLESLASTVEAQAARLVELDAMYEP